jgi:hypothetical protein
MTSELLRLHPLPEILDPEPQQDTPEPPPSADDDGDPLRVMRDHLKLFVRQGRAVAEALAELGDDPARADERRALGRTYLHRAQRCAESLVPFCAPKVGAIAYKEPPPKAAGEGSLADAIPEGTPLDKATEIYRRLVRGEG